MSRLVLIHQRIRDSKPDKTDPEPFYKFSFCCLDLIEQESDDEVLLGCHGE